MPFPALTSAGFSASEDSQYFQDTPINGGLFFTTDGGLIISRRRYTRNPGSNIVTGFTEMSVQDKNLLDQFFASSGYGANTVQYLHPLSGQTINVLINSDPPYTSAYKGYGPTKVWTITDLKLRVV